MAIIRWLLGSLILFLDWVFTPRGTRRETATQDVVNLQTRALTLYQYKACPFCVKVRRAMKRQSLKIETRDVKRSELAKQELLAGGGGLKVPCLRIEGDRGEIEWMYESTEIINYLARRFASTEHTTAAI